MCQYANEFLINMKMLGFDQHIHFKNAPHLILDENIFLQGVNNSRAFEIISRYLFRCLDKKRTLHDFKECWPITDRYQSRKYVQIAYRWLEELHTKDNLLKYVPVRKSHLETCHGPTMNKLMLAFSTAVLSKVAMSKMDTGISTIHKLNTSELKERIHMLETRFIELETGKENYLHERRLKGKRLVTELDKSTVAVAKGKMLSEFKADMITIKDDLLSKPQTTSSPISSHNTSNHNEAKKERRNSTDSEALMAVSPINTINHSDNIPNKATITINSPISSHSALNHMENDNETKDDHPNSALNESTDNEALMAVSPIKTSNHIDNIPSKITTTTCNHNNNIFSEAATTNSNHNDNISSEATTINNNHNDIIPSGVTTSSNLNNANITARTIAPAEPLSTTKQEVITLPQSHNLRREIYLILSRKGTLSPYLEFPTTLPQPAFDIDSAIKNLMELRAASQTANSKSTASRRSVVSGTSTLADLTPVSPATSFTNSHITSSEVSAVRTSFDVNTIEQPTLSAKRSREDDDEDEYEGSRKRIITSSPVRSPQQQENAYTGLETPFMFSDENVPNLINERPPWRTIIGDICDIDLLSPNRKN